jgi:hypothetical protein
MLTEDTKDRILSIVILIGLIAFLLFSGPIIYGQSIMISNDGRYMLEHSEEEKAIKTSSSLIKAKTDIVWETHLNKVKIMWELKYRKDTKMYLLYKNHIKYYESSTITGIRSKYASDLLGREIKVQ